MSRGVEQFDNAGEAPGKVGVVGGFSADDRPSADLEVVASLSGQPTVKALLRPLAALCRAAGGPDAEGDVGAKIAQWVQSFLMRPNPDLGRLGDVCPYVSRAARIGTSYIGICDAGPDDAALIVALMEAAFRKLDQIPCTKAAAQFRSIVIGFPNCATPAGLKVMKQIQDQFAPQSVFGGKLIGFLWPDAPDKGLINPDFHTMRSPVPLFSIRPMVEGDAPFVIRNRWLVPIYLIKFPRVALPRLFTAFNRRRAQHVLREKSNEYPNGLGQKH